MKPVSPVAGLVLASASAVASNAAAEDCFILVHGHGVYEPVDDPDDDRTLEQVAFDYWSETAFSRPTADFVAQVTGGTQNYGVVAWDSGDEAALPYWHEEAAGSVAQQILDIAEGRGDGMPHDRQCNAEDRAFVIAHSQGAQVMTYISANSDDTGLYPDTAFTSKTVEATSTPNSDEHCDKWGLDTCWYEDETVTVDENSLGNAVAAPFSDVRREVALIFTMGGAINGTEGADRLCAGGWQQGLGQWAGRDCENFKTLQTHRIYNPDAYSGDTLRIITLNMAGWGEFPGAYSASSQALNGLDDGYINIASQMNCQGSGKRSLDEDLRRRDYPWPFGTAAGPDFTCDVNHKRHFNSLNLASLEEDHDSEKNGCLSSPAFATGPAVSGITCGRGENMPNLIRTCLGN